MGRGWPWVEGAWALTFWPYLVAKDLDTLIEQSLTLIEQSYYNSLSL